MHEVVTLQFGNRANYLSTHCWNTQESYFTYPTPQNPLPEPSLVDHDIHFRPGIGADGSDTYTPRTLIYDLQSSFGGLRKTNALYDTLKQDEVVRGLWDGVQQTHTVPPIPPIPYQVNLESGLPTPQLHARDVRYWSDFNRLFYHPRSIIQLSNQSLSASLHSDDSWSTGAELFKETDRQADILDRDVRPFAEECDSLSTFQIFSGVDDSWGGYASSYVEALEEEYGKKGVWVWAIEDGHRVERAKQYQRLANAARSVRAMAPNVSAYIRLSTVPSSLPAYVDLEAGSDWSTSALLCAAAETVTLPARLRRSEGIGGTTTTGTSFEDTLNTNGNHKIWTLKARATNDHGRTTNTNPSNGHTPSQSNDPRMRTTSNEEASNDLQPSSFDIDYTPDVPTAQSTFPSLRSTTHNSTSDNEHIFAQIESRRPIIPQSPTTSPHHLRPTSHVLAPEVLIRRAYDSESIVSVYDTPLPFPLLDSYPATLFRVRAHGGGDPLKRAIRIDAALSTTSRTKKDILGLRDLVVGRAGRAMGLIETEEQEGMYDELTGLAEGYGFGFEDDLSGSDEGGDGGGDG